LNALAKYLDRHAEPEARAADLLNGTFGHALEVPAYGEGESLFGTLASIPGGALGEVLVVLVLNAREDSPEHVHRANQETRERLDREAPATSILSEEPRVSLRRLGQAALLVIDRALPGRFLPEGQGVGLARKIGCDLILRLRAAGRIASPWIHCTDADVLLPEDYFGQLPGGEEERGAAAAIYFFEHRVEPDEELARAARLYEISLRYYVLGLAWAGSPYAYQSMGSCLAVRDTAYAAVRGFPRRNALEDFYVLNKLAKTGTILRLAGSPVILEGRLSDRVPISTGKAIGEIVSRAPRSRRRSALDHPLAFAHLAAWIRVIGAVARSGGHLDRALETMPRDNPFFRAEVLQDALRKFGAFEGLRETLDGARDPRTLAAKLHGWFDGFRTVKLLHALRDAGLPSLPWREALSEAPFTGLSTSTDEDEEELLRALASEERKLAAIPAGVPALEIEDA
jgi:hypothetical protein